MPEESTTPDLVALTDRLREAANRRDVDSMVSFFTPDAVVGYAEGLGTFEGARRSVASGKNGSPASRSFGSHGRRRGTSATESYFP